MVLLIIEEAITFNAIVENVPFVLKKKKEEENNNKIKKELLFLNGLACLTL